jgi:7-cyano-7-deazaguanine synthase
MTATDRVRSDPVLVVNDLVDSEALFIGAHSEDFSGCPDCRPAFFDAFQNVINVGTKPETEIELKAPFVE